MAFQRAAFRPHSRPVNREKKQQLREQKKRSLLVTQKRYESLLISTQLEGKTAYMLRPEPPDFVLNAGGFTTKGDPWFATVTGNNFDTCNNEGTICLSLLPEVAALFSSNRDLEKNKQFIYAIPLEEEMILLGGKWRQVVSPGALPLPNVWRCREVFKINDNKVVLGPVMGQGCDSTVVKGEKYEAYLNPYIRLPNAIGVGEDYPEEYEIQDTKMTSDFQNSVNFHYQKALYKKI